MELFEAIQTRRSYRGFFRPEPIPRETLTRILEAILAAPSGCNKQTVSAIGVDDPAAVKALGDILGKPNFASAPACICILTNRQIAWGDTTYFRQDYGAAIENGLLAITALGLASCWVEGGVCRDPEIARNMARVLQVPEELHLVCFLPVGIPAEPFTQPQKRPFEERAWFNRYGSPEGENNK